MPSLRDRLSRLDDRIFGIERWVVGGAFLAMALVVFLDVAHRIFTRVPGRLASILANILGSFGVDTTAAELDTTVAPALILLFAYLAAYGALRTRTPDPGKAPPTKVKAMFGGIAITAVLTGLVQLAIVIKPDGIVWAPYFGLSMLLWVGLVGASMATYAGRHLALEMGEKLWPERLRPKVKAVSQLLAGLFALLIGVLASMSVSDHFAAWSQNPMAGLLPSVDLPKWLMFSVVPYSFFMIAWRFAGRALGLLPQPPEPEIPT